MAKSKKLIQIEKAEASKAKNISSQSELFLPSRAKKRFTKLRQVFIEAPILNHFHPKRYIQIEMNAFGYIIGRILSQLTLDDSNQ